MADTFESAGISHVAFLPAARQVVPDSLMDSLSSGSAADATASGAVALIDADTADDDLLDGQFCGGALVSGNVVLTAAHCVDSLDPGDVDVIVGTADLCGTPSAPEDRITVESIVLGPEDSDSAVLILGGAAPVQPYKIGSVNATTSTFHAEAFGWGDLSDDLDSQCERKDISLTIVNENECHADAAEPGSGALDPEFDLCALPSVGEDLNTCNGDSGGPVVIAGEDGQEVVGLTDWGNDCAPTSYGGYVNVGAIADWVGQMIGLGGDTAT